MEERSIERKNPLTFFFNPVGRKTVRIVADLGAVLIFFVLAFVKIFQRKQIREITQQVFYIGAKSTGIVTLVALFTGMVLGLQLFYTLIKFGSEGVLGSAIALSLVRELGPVLTAIMITARAEIGILRISEQIDALYTMRIDPMRFIVSPKIAASIISFPLLTAFFDLVGILGGYLTGVALLNVNGGAYIYRVQSSLNMSDVRGGFVKALVFGAIVSTICCYRGYFCHMGNGHHGAKAVSIATTSAVVLSCVMVLIADYVVTSFIM